MLSPGDSTSKRGVGSYAFIQGLSEIQDNGLWTTQYTIVDATFQSFLTGSPDMPRYKKWVTDVADGLRTQFDEQGNWSKLREYYLLHRAFPLGSSGSHLFSSSSRLRILSPNAEKNANFEKPPSAVQLDRFPMSSQLLSPNREAAIWARLMRAQEDELPPDAAEFLLSIDFEEGDRQRMSRLAEVSEAGTLTVEEQAEFDSYLHIGNLLAVMQSKARLALKRKPRNRRSS
jgi:hypothetical protein